MKPAHIDAIHELARNDPAVHAFVRTKYQKHLQWDDVLAEMSLHLAQEKAKLTARLLEIAANTAPAKIVVVQEAQP